MSNASETRITRRFAALKEEGRAGLVAFVTAGDPDRALGQKILNGLPAAGADVIELGMSFTDPMADGPAIQAGSLRALASGNTLQITLDMVAEFRQQDDDTPIVLMGYYNPIYSYGVDKFLTAATKAGVDGLIIVDLPPEEDDELCLPAIDAGINFIRLATPTTDDDRLPQVIKNTSGFLYYVSVAGITGAKAPDMASVKAELTRIRKSTDMPIAVGFGIKTPEQAAEIASFADAAVVGSALVEAVREGLDDKGQGTQASVDNVLRLVGDLAQGVKGARG